MSPLNIFAFYLKMSLESLDQMIPSKLKDAYFVKREQKNVACSEIYNHIVLEL